MSPGRVQDPEGAKTITLSYNSPSGAVAAIIKRRFLITCYTEQDTCRLRLDPSLTAGTAARARKGAKKILIYDSHMHPFSALDPISCGPGTTPRGRSTCIVNTLKIIENFEPIPTPDQNDSLEKEDMDTNDKQVGTKKKHRATQHIRTNNACHAAPGRHAKATIAIRTKIPQGRGSEGATSPERRTHNAPVVQNNIKHNYNNNKFHPLAEEHNEEDIGNDRVREGSVSYASRSRGSRMRDPVTFTPEILAMMVSHEPEKAKQAKLLTEHLTSQRTLPSTEEELRQHL